MVCQKKKEKKFLNKAAFLAADLFFEIRVSWGNIKCLSKLWITQWWPPKLKAFFLVITLSQPALDHSMVAPLNLRPFFSDYFAFVLKMASTTFFNTLNSAPSYVSFIRPPLFVRPSLGLNIQLIHKLLRMLTLFVCDYYHPTEYSCIQLQLLQQKVISLKKSLFF